MSFRQIKSPALADKAVINTKLDQSAVQGQSTLTGMDTPENCFTLLYDVGSDSLKKISTAAFFGSFSTDDLAEGDVKFFTDERAKTAVASDISSAVATETNRASAAEELLRTALATETTRAQTAESANAQSIVDESSRAVARENVIESGYQSADAALSLRIDNILSNTDETALNSLAEIVAAFEGADDVLSASVISNSGAIATEIARATDAEQANASAIATETAARQSADATLTQNIADETAARIAGDNALSGRMTTAEGDIDSLESGLSSEIARATAAESVLTSDLAAEVARATGAEEANAESIQQEIAARGLADTAVRVDLTAGYQAGDAATLASAKAHDALLVGDASVDGSAGNTVTDRIATAKAEAVSEATQDLLQEISDREDGEDALQTALDAEIVRAKAAEVVNADAISAEETRATGEEARIEAKLDNVISNTDSEALDSLTEIVAEFQRVDGEVSALVSSNTTAISSEQTARSSADQVLQTNIETEASTRAAADVVLQGEIDAIDAAYVAADVVVASNAAADATSKADTAKSQAIAHADAQDTALIGDASVDGTAGNTVSARILSAKQAANTYSEGLVNAEAATRLAADDALSLRATALEGRATVNESDIDSLEADLTSETTARVAGDNTLQANITAEAGIRAAADVVLQDNITAEATRAQTAEQANTTSISNEVTRATGVEAGLRTDVDANTVSAAANLASINSEVTRAKAAEVANGVLISDEVTRAKAAEVVLQGNIDSEEAARIAGDAALRTDVDANAAAHAANATDISDEATTARAAELANAQAITAEETRATGVEAGLRTDVNTVTGRVDAIIGTSPETLDTLQEIVAAFEDADSDIQGIISANSGRLSVNEADIDAVELRAGDLEVRATAVEGRATALETGQSAQGGRLTVNEGDIDGLETKVGSATLLTTASDLSAALNEVHAELDVEAGKVSTLESEMDAAEGRLDAVEPKVSTLESEMDAAEGRLTVNEADIDALEAKVGSAEVALDTTAQTLVGSINEVHGEVNAVVARVDGHDSDIASNLAAVVAEASRATGQEALIRGEFAAEDTAIRGEFAAADAIVAADAAADATSKANAAEANAKVYADTIVSDEAVARENADNVLQSAITAESNARQIADNGLSNRATALETEMTATQSGAGLATDGSFVAPTGTGHIDTAVSLKDASLKLDAAIVAEATRASAAEVANGVLISNETAARIAGDVALQSALDAEVVRSTGVDSDQAVLITGNATAISDEAAARVAADAALQTQIDFIKSNVDEAALDSLTEIVGAFQAADGTLTGLVSANEAAHTQNATDIASETAARVAADNALRTDFENADDALQIDVDSKVSKSGDSMTGSLAMGSNKVTGLGNGVDAADAVNKGQLDAGLAAQHISEFSTSDLEEGSNLYYTDARVHSAVSVTDVSGEGKVSVTDGVFSIDTAKSLLELTDVVDSSTTDKEGFVLRAKTDGTGFELVNPDLLSFSRSKRQVFQGDGAQTIFAIDFDVTEQNAMVFVGGVIQDPSVHYFIDVANGTITFNGAIPVGTQAVLVAQSSTSVGVLDPGSVTLETLAPNVKVFQQGADVIVGTSPTTVSSFPTNVYRSAKYVVTVELDGEFETRECLVIHNGTSAYITEYGIIYTGDDLLGDTDVRVVGGVVQLTYQAVSAGAVVTASASYVDV